MTAISLDAVTKAFDDGSRRTVALRDLTLDIHDEEFVTVLGPSGCGKTTLLRLIADLIEPTSGTVTGPEPGDIGFVFQDYALFPWRTVRGNLELALRFAGNGDRDAVDRYLDQVGLARYADAYPHELSGGMRQRVALTRALVYDPGVLLMDEPFAALDELTKRSLYDWFADFLGDTDRVVVYVTHNIAEAYLFADRLILMNGEGRVVDRIEPSSDAPRTLADTSSDEFIDLQDAILDQLEGDLGVA